MVFLFDVELDDDDLDWDRLQNVRSLGKAEAHDQGRSSKTLISPRQWSSLNTRTGPAVGALEKGVHDWYYASTVVLVL